MDSSHTCLAPITLARNHTKVLLAFHGCKSVRCLVVDCGRDVSVSFQASLTTAPNAMSIRRIGNRMIKRTVLPASILRSFVGVAVLRFGKKFRNSLTASVNYLIHEITERIDISRFTHQAHEATLFG